MIIHQGAKMAIAHKTSRKRAASRKRPTAARASSGELAQLVQMITRMGRTLDKLVAVQRRGRTPLPEYAKVIAIGTAAEVADVRGHIGIVLDAACSDDGQTYTVYFPVKQEALVLHEQSLWDTGQTIPEDVIYGGGETRRVRVDANGNGTMVA
jgi:hypothetical protein